MFQNEEDILDRRESLRCHGSWTMLISLRRGDILTKERVSRINKPEWPRSFRSSDSWHCLWSKYQTIHPLHAHHHSTLCSCWRRIHLQSALFQNTCSIHSKNGGWGEGRDSTLLFAPGRWLATVTNRRLYNNRFFARPLGVFFFSCFSTLGVWDLTLPARAREPCCLPCGS